MNISPTLFGCNTMPIPPCIDAAHGQTTHGSRISAFRGAISCADSHSLLPHAQTSDSLGPRMLGQATEIAPAALRYPHFTSTPYPSGFQTKSA
jgi:hypothetical protein